jgi:hypothetical protein
MRATRGACLSGILRCPCPTDPDRKARQAPTSSRGSHRRESSGSRRQPREIGARPGRSQPRPPARHRRHPVQADVRADPARFGRGGDRIRRRHVRRAGHGRTRHQPRRRGAPRDRVDRWVHRHCREPQVDPGQPEPREVRAPTRRRRAPARASERRVREGKNFAAVVEARPSRSGQAFCPSNQVLGAQDLGCSLRGGRRDHDGVDARHVAAGGIGVRREGVLAPDHEAERPAAGCGVGTVVAGAVG